MSALQDELRAVVRAELAAFAPPVVEPKPATLTTAELAHELRCCNKTVDRLRAEGMPHIRLGDSPRFELAKVLNWLNSRGKAA